MLRQPAKLREGSNLQDRKGSIWMDLFHSWRQVYRCTGVSRFKLSMC
jgi:hypothetical protein